MDQARSDYTVFMTKGTHVVSYDAAMQILEAVSAGTKHITVPVESFGSVNPTNVTLIVSHVVSLMEHDQEPCDFGNVRALRR